MSAFRGHDKKETTYPKSKFFNPCFNSQMKTNAEIRMRGFLKRTPVPELLELIRKHCRLNRSEQVELEHLGGRVLAEPIRSPLDVPNFNRSAMDGYALKAEETFGATRYAPLLFEVVGEVTPGTQFGKTVRTGQAVRIMTGGPVPEGADAILIAEHAEAEGDRISVQEPVPPGKHIGFRGEDIHLGTELFDAGRKLRPQDIGLLASVGMQEALVTQRPIIDLLITGNELLPPGSKPEGVYIVDSNSLMLRQLAERDGAVIGKILHLRDERERIRKALLDSEADLVCVTGGTSVGKEDHAPTLLEEVGTLLVHGIPMRPAAPTGFGLIGNRKVFLLPGNPVSCISAYDCFVGLALRRMGGLGENWPYRSIKLPLSSKIASQIGRIEYVRLQIHEDKAEPIASGGASILSSTTRADAFLLTQESSEGFAEGEEVEAWLYD